MQFPPQKLLFLLSVLKSKLQVLCNVLLLNCLVVVLCLEDNKIYSWGNGNSGQLGIGTQESSPQPRPMTLGVSSGTKLKGITCGTRHSFVWTEDGDCFSFGNNYSGQLGYDFRRLDYKENQVKMPRHCIFILFVNIIKRMERVLQVLESFLENLNSLV